MTGHNGGKRSWFFGGADEEVVGVEDFIRNVVLMADDVLAQCGGGDAYVRKWGDIPFPSRGLETLRA
jgi:hypothetical protein